MIKNCPYYGIKTRTLPGTKVFCPACSASLVTVNSQGRAWVPEHEPHHHVDTYASIKKVARRGAY